jgi:hypothetical protein
MSNWHKQPLEQAFYADVEIRERLYVFREKRRRQCSQDCYGQVAA